MASTSKKDAGKKKPSTVPGLDFTKSEEFLEVDVSQALDELPKPPASPIAVVRENFARDSKLWEYWRRPAIYTQPMDRTTVSRQASGWRNAKTAQGGKFETKYLPNGDGRFWLVVKYNPKKDEATAPQGSNQSHHRP